MSNLETKTTNPNIEMQRVMLSPEDQAGVKQQIEASAGSRVNVSSQLLVRPEDDPQSSAALDGINLIGSMLTQTDDRYRSIGLVQFGEPENPDALAFVSGQLSATQIEVAQDRMLHDINSVLAKLNSPYRA